MRLDAENGVKPWHIPVDCVMASDAKRDNFTENAGKKHHSKLHIEHFCLSTQWTLSKTLSIF